MTSDEFNLIVEDVFDKCKNVLIEKAKEYVLDKNDRLKAFKLEYLNCPINSKETLWGALVKHITSVYDMCKQGPEFDKTHLDQWDAKIIDIINYMVLLKGIVIDNANNRK